MWQPGGRTGRFEKFIIRRASSTSCVMRAPVMGRRLYQGHVVSLE
jgi:hypothetical protein